MPEVSTSMITKSGFSARTILSASSPSQASSNRCPWSRSSVVTKRRLTGLSSMARIVATTLPGSHPVLRNPLGPASGQLIANEIIMPPSCVNTGNKNVTEGEPKGGGREAVPAPTPQTHAIGLAERLGPLHSPGFEPLDRWRFGSALNHLTAAASSLKL